MKKPARKSSKLNLSLETVQTLTEKQLGLINGGALGSNSCEIDLCQNKTNTCGCFTGDGAC